MAISSPVCLYGITVVLCVLFTVNVVSCMVCQFGGRRGVELRRRQTGLRRRRGLLLGRVGLGFFAGVDRSLHAPLALVVDPLRVLLSRALSSKVHGGLGAVGGGTRRLLASVGSLLSFQGLSMKTRATRCGSKSVIGFVHRVYDAFRRCTLSRAVDFYFVYRMRGLGVSFSPIGVGGMVGGLLSGTFGCAPSGKRVGMRLCHRSSGMYVYITSGKRNVVSGSGGRVFRHFCRIRRASRGANDKVNLRVTGRCMRLRGKAVSIASGFPGNSMFAIGLPVIACTDRGRRLLPRLLGGSGTPGRLPIPGTRRLQCAVLLISSGGSFYDFVSRCLSSRCTVRITCGKTRTLGVLRGGDIGVMVDSVVVPIVGKARLYQRVGAGVR